MPYFIKEVTQEKKKVCYNKHCGVLSNPNQSTSITQNKWIHISANGKVDLYSYLLNWMQYAQSKLGSWEEKYAPKLLNFLNQFLLLLVEVNFLDALTSCPDMESPPLFPKLTYKMGRVLTRQVLSCLLGSFACI